VCKQENVFVKWMANLNLLKSFQISEISFFTYRGSLWIVKEEVIEENECGKSLQEENLSRYEIKMEGIRYLLN
jgi:hypothetical protein